MILLPISSLPTNTTTSPNHHHHQNPKPKPSLHHQHYHTLYSPPKPTLHSRSLLQRTLPTTQILNRPNSSLLTHYALLASNLAVKGRLHDFLEVVESAIASGVDASRLGVALSEDSVAKGVLDSLKEGNVEAVVVFLKKITGLGVDSGRILDGVDVEFVKGLCLRLVRSVELEVVVDLMETLSGFGFSIQELVEPSEVIRTCVEERNPKMAIRYARALPFDRLQFCTIIKEFGRKRDLKSALYAYEASKEDLGLHNMYAHRTAIDVCGLCGDYLKSRSIYEDLLAQDVTPNIYVLNSLMNVNSHDLRYTLQAYKNMQDLGVAVDVASYNILLKSCCLAGRVDVAQDIYKEMKLLESTGSLKLDAFTYCTIIKIFADAKLWKMALKIKEDMVASGAALNTHTWSSLISACANAGLVEPAIQLFEEMLLSCCQPNSQCCNILLHACVEACQYDRAFRLFESWKGSEVDRLGKEHAQGQSETIVQNVASRSHHLNFIKKFPFTPEEATYNILMKACGSDYRRAKALLDEMQTVGLSPNNISWSILIDMCAVSGNVEGAIQILRNMHEAGVEPDVVAYTTAIKVCVERKNLQLAFSLFSEMKRRQIKPNLVTYNTLLRARTRYGSFKEVQQCLSIYQEMRKAGYKSNDYYLKHLIEEWCEGVMQGSYQSQIDPKVSSDHRKDSRTPYTLLFERVAEHLQNNVADSLAIDLQGLTKVEARILVLAVLRMIKENYFQGHSIKDDVWITLGVDTPDMPAAKQESKVKDAILKLLQNELGLDVRSSAPRITSREPNSEEDFDVRESFHRNIRKMTSPRRPVVLERLKITLKSLHHWLKRRVGPIRDGNSSHMT